MAIAPGVARADTLLCDLTQTEVMAMLDYYDSDLTWQEIAPYVASPFTCGPYGDLCRELGNVRANTWLCNRWNDMEAHLPQSTVEANAASDFDIKQTAWFNVRYPDGVPDDDVFWSYLPTTATVTTSTKKLAHSTWTVNGGMATAIGSTLTSFSKSAGRWSRQTNATVTIDSDWSSSSMSGAADCVEAPTTTSDTDGKVTAGKWGMQLAFWASVPNQLESTGDSSALSGSTAVAVEGLWFFGGCP